MAALGAGALAAAIPQLAFAAHYGSGPNDTEPEMRYAIRLVDDPAVDSVYAHESPNTASDVVWSIPFDSPVAVLQRVTGEKLWYGSSTWSQVQLPYDTGWVYEPLLGRQPQGEAMPPSPGPVPAPASAPGPVGKGRSIVISLADQFLWAFEGRAVACAVGCTTGGVGLETPTGDFAVKKHIRDYQFNSPWPKGAWFYYESVQASYALQFYGRSFFLHDAPWRRVFGPVSQGGTGKLGGDYTGSHGCVNLPYPAARFLYNWAPDGTPVRIS
jgi:hypothetical protein